MGLKRVELEQEVTFARNLRSRSRWVIKLQGSAQSDADKLAIEETICRAAGVVRVVNEMRVKPVVALIKRIPMSVPLTDAVGPPMLVHRIPTQYPVAKATQ